MGVVGALGCATRDGAEPEVFRVYVISARSTREAKARAAEIFRERIREVML